MKQYVPSSLCIEYPKPVILEVAKGGAISVKGMRGKGDNYRVDHYGARGVSVFVPGCLENSMTYHVN
jgi:hypothetical protein